MERNILSLKLLNSTIAKTLESNINKKEIFIFLTI